MAWVTSFLDGFDHYATADIGAKWDNADLSASITSSQFRNSGSSLNIGSGPAAYQMSKKLNLAARNIVFGMGLRFGSAPSGTAFSGSGAFAVLSNEPAYGSTTQLAFTVANDGKLHIGRCTSTGLSFVGATDNWVGTTVFGANTWYWVEIRVYIHDTAGAIEVRVNGVVDLLVTGADTKAHATLDVAEYINIRGLSVTQFIDDFYIRTEASSSEVTGGFLGDIKVKPYYPNADGTYTAMTCSTGSTHNTLVDETAPNTTDYVSSSTALTKDSYGFQDASETGSIKAVQVSAYCYKADAGFRGAEVFIKSGATEVFGTSQPLSTTGKYVVKLFEQDPNTSADWSQTNLNAAEFGVRISADV